MRNKLQKLAVLNLVASIVCLTAMPPATAGDSEPYSASAVGHFNQGVEYMQRGQLEQALSEYRLALSADNRMEEAYSNMGAVYAELGDHGSAIDSFKKALALKPNRSHTLNLLATVLYDEGRVQEAKETWGRTVGQDSNYIPAIYNLGVAFEAENDLEGAYVAYRHALQLAPNFGDAQERLGRLTGQTNVAVSTPVQQEEQTIVQEQPNISMAMAPSVVLEETVATSTPIDESAPMTDFATADTGSSYHSQFALAMKNASRTR